MQIITQKMQKCKKRKNCTPAKTWHVGQKFRRNLDEKSAMLHSRQPSLCLYLEKAGSRILIMSNCQIKMGQVRYECLKVGLTGYLRITHVGKDSFFIVFKIK